MIDYEDRQSAAKKALAQLEDLLGEIGIPCLTVGCGNEGRYSSGYCGVCDVVKNDGQGELMR